MTEHLTQQLNKRSRPVRHFLWTGILIVILLLGGASLYSHAAMHRSLAASAAEAVIRFAQEHPTYEEETGNLRTLREHAESARVVPEGVSFTEEFAQQTFNGMTTWYLNSSNHSNISILYLHGGAYVRACSTAQWRLVNDIANSTDAEVIVPDYPLAPHHTYEEAYAALYDWYVPWQVGNDSRILIIMGDAAGGGLALGFTQYLKEQGTPLPDGVIILSPWVDLTMSNPEIAAYQAADPLLSTGELLADAENWAGGTDLTSWQLSPTYGDLTDLPDVYIYAGTREILYPDCVALYEKLLAAGNYAHLIVGEGMNHDYLLLPIPERQQGIREMTQIVAEIAS